MKSYQNFSELVFGSRCKMILKWGNSMEIYLRKVDNNTLTYLFGDIIGLPYEHTTPEWNISYYRMLLKYTNKSILRKKHEKILKWWVEIKAKRDKIRNSIGKYKNVRWMTKETIDQIFNKK